MLARALVRLEELLVIGGGGKPVAWLAAWMGKLTGFGVADQGKPKGLVELAVLAVIRKALPRDLVVTGGML